MIAKNFSPMTFKTPPNKGILERREEATQQEATRKETRSLEDAPIGVITDDPQRHDASPDPIPDTPQRHDASPDPIPDTPQILIQEEKSVIQEKRTKENPTLVFPAPNGPQRVSVGIPRKKPLEPGFSPLDWANLSKSGKNLSGVAEIKRYKPSEIAVHNQRHDLWLAFNGKVYNATPYLKYHPGGTHQLMRGAGKDCTTLFNQIHPWVNLDKMLEKCFVGYLLPE